MDSVKWYRLNYALRMLAYVFLNITFYRILKIK